MVKKHTKGHTHNHNHNHKAPTPPQDQSPPHTHILNQSPTTSTQSLMSSSNNASFNLSDRSHAHNHHGHDAHDHHNHSHSPPKTANLPPRTSPLHNPYSSYQAESTSTLELTSLLEPAHNHSHSPPALHHTNSFHNDDHSHGVCSHTKLAPDCGHNECSDMTDPKTAQSQRVLTIVTCLCFGFMCVELVGGYLSGSLAIMTDAAHLLSDLISFIISLLSITVATRSPTKSMTFGWKRVEIVGAIVSVFLIWGLTVVLVYESIHRIINPDLIDVNGKIMLIVAVIGFLVNIIMGTFLMMSGEEHAHSHGGLPAGHGHSHGGASHDDHSDEDEDDHGHAHGHGHDHGHGHNDKAKSPLLRDHHGHAHGNHHDDHDDHHDDEHAEDKSVFTKFYEIIFPPNKQRSININAALLHVLGDLMQSVGVIIAALIIWWNPALKLADPLCTLLFSVIVISTTFRVMKQGFRVLLEGTPDGVDSQQVAATLRNIPSVIAVHDLHIWSLSVDSPALAVHLVVQFDASESNSNYPLATGPEQVLEQVNAVLKKKWKITHTTIQLEEQFKSGVCVPKATPCKRTNSGLEGSLV